jgi:hypothetical protein
VGKRDTLLLQLHHKFGDIPNRVMDGIARTKNLEELDALTPRAIDAKSIMELYVVRLLIEKIG